MSDFRYLSPQQIVDSKCYPFTLPQLRHFLLFRHRNGLENAVRKVGKRLIIRMDLFEVWIESQTSKKSF